MLVSEIFIYNRPVIGNIKSTPIWGRISKILLDNSVGHFVGVIGMQMARQTDYPAGLIFLEFFPKWV